MTDRLLQSELDMELFKLRSAQRRLDSLLGDPSSTTLDRHELALDVEKIKERIEVLKDKLGYDDGSPLVRGASWGAAVGSWSITTGGGGGGGYASGGMIGGVGGGSITYTVPPATVSGAGYARGYTMSTSTWREANGFTEPELEDNGIVSWSKDEDGWLPLSGNWILVYACGCRRKVHRDDAWTLEALDALRVSDEFATCTKCFSPYVEMLEVRDGE